jgi:hypothetical protein
MRGEKNNKKEERQKNTISTLKENFTFLIVS